MAQTATVVGTLNLPSEDAATASPIDLALSLAFAERSAVDLKYDSPVVDGTVPLGTMATNGAKLIYVKCTLGSCNIKINGMTTAFPLSVASGYVLMANIAQGAVLTLTVSSVTVPMTLRVVGLA